MKRGLVYGLLNLAFVGNCLFSFTIVEGVGLDNCDLDRKRKSGCCGGVREGLKGYEIRSVCDEVLITKWTTFPPMIFPVMISVL